MNLQKKKQIKIQRRRDRVQVKGTAEKPRISVFRSLKFIYAQMIDDEAGKTLASVSGKEIKDKMKKIDAARELGKALAEKAKAKGIEKAVFDKGSYKFHGRVKAFADGAREGGLKF